MLCEQPIYHLDQTLLDLVSNAPYLLTAKPDGLHIWTDLELANLGVPVGAIFVIVGHVVDLHQRPSDSS